MSGRSVSFQPTFIDFATEAPDAAMLLQACFQEHLPRIYQNADPFGFV